MAQSDNDRREEGVLMLAIENLDEATVERAGARVAREHAAARRVRPELPAAFDSAEVCAAALEHLYDSGHHGLVTTDKGRTVAVMTAAVRENPAVGRYARLPAEGFAVEPLSRPFWLSTGFRLAGYDVLRLIDGGAGSARRESDGEDDGDGDAQLLRSR
jgi:hypothetical protein